MNMISINARLHFSPWIPLLCVAHFSISLVFGLLSHEVHSSATLCGRCANSGVLKLVSKFDSEFSYDTFVEDSNHMTFEKISPSMISGAVGTEKESRYKGARIGPPPDLPSLLLHNRIVYVGMPLVPSVTELIIAELLYLNYESSTKPIHMYFNTPGTSTYDGKLIGFETEAFAIADCMKYVKPPVYTTAVGQAFGTAAMLLSQGHKGNRSALPNASIMLHQPKSQSRGQASDIAIKAKEVMSNRRIACSMLSQACGKPYDEVERDVSRTFYMTPEEAVEYGLIDKVLNVTKRGNKVTPQFLEAINRAEGR